VERRVEHFDVDDGLALFVAGRRAQVTVVVAGRFIVNATARNVESADAPRAIVEKIGLTQLAGLK
jgi:hypothetical protein